MELDDLKCCGNCEHFCNTKCNLADKEITFPDVDTVCAFWKWDANTMANRIWNGRE